MSAMDSSNGSAEMNRSEQGTLRNGEDDEELLTADERRGLMVRDALQSVLANVAPNRKVERFQQVVGEAAYLLIGPNVSFTITATEPSIDLSGRRRKQVA